MVFINALFVGFSWVAKYY